MTDGTLDPSAEGAALCVYAPQEGEISSFEWITDAEAEGKVLLNENDVETVVQLINQNARAKHHVNIGVDAEDYYRIKNQK